MIRSYLLKIAAAAAIAFSAAPAGAQVTTVDPNDSAAQQEPEWVPADEAGDAAESTQEEAAATAEQPVPAQDAGDRASEAARGGKVPRGDVFSAAESVFGKGAEGMAEIIEDLLRKQGEPNAYITGREAGGAFVAGVRYGSGTLHHQIEGDRRIHWTGPSVGFDFGADAAKVFVLVYNLHDSQRIFKRFPAAEGNAYVVGGFTASYLRRGDVVLIPIRLGVGARLGVNAGYMRFSQKTRWLPF
jgi:hypothetical protein